MVNKNAYYLDFTVEKFLAGKELLKSMPMFFNRIYFCKKYANALWYGESKKHYSNIALIADAEIMDSLREIIKNNFLYIKDWDSKDYIEDDYGFSFIAGNIKFIVMSYDEIESGYIIKSYDVDTRECKTTTLETNKKFFLDSSINSNGEFVRTCLFDLEDANNTNSETFTIEKEKEPTMAIYENKGYIVASTRYFLTFMIIVLAIVWVLYAIMKISALT